MAEQADRDVTVDRLVSRLILLERDATAAYVRILHRLADPGARQEMTRLLDNRQRRLAELTMMSFTLRSASPDEADATHYLPAGRVAVETLSDDSAILSAMLAGEAETVTAYERASAHPEALPKCRAIFERAHRDAVQHFSWMEKAARALQA
jgi:hypothetical protein